MGKLIKGNFGKTEDDEYQGYGCNALLQLFRNVEPYKEPEPTNVIDNITWHPHQHKKMFEDGDFIRDITSVEWTIEAYGAESLLEALPLKTIMELREYFIGPEEPNKDGIERMIKALPYRGTVNNILDDGEKNQDLPYLESIIILKRLLKEHGVDSVMYGLYEWHVDKLKEWFENHRQMKFSKGM